MDHETRSTRARLIDAMVEALASRGYHGVGLAELLAAAQAPKGVLYHHFPGGKAELAVRAIEAVAEQMSADLEALIQEASEPLDAMTRWVDSAQTKLKESGFQSGCPLATIALESGKDDETIRRALHQAFTLLRERTTRVLAEFGLDSVSARGIAALIVSAYEGALLQARVAENVDTMSEATTALSELLRPRLQEAAAGPGRRSAGLRARLTGTHGIPHRGARRLGKTASGTAYLPSTSSDTRNQRGK